MLHVCTHIPSAMPANSPESDHLIISLPRAWQLLELVSDVVSRFRDLSGYWIWRLIIVVRFDAIVFALLVGTLWRVGSL